MASNFLQSRHAIQEQNHLKNHTPASSLNFFSEQWHEKKMSFDKNNLSQMSHGKTHRKLGSVY